MQFHALPSFTASSSAGPVLWLAHGHALMGEGLAAVLARHGAVQRVAGGTQPSHGEEPPALVVTDRRLGVCGGRVAWGTVPVLVVDTGLCGREVRQLLDAGVQGCVHAEGDLHHLDGAVSAVMQGARHLCPLSAAALAQDVVQVAFTPREAQVLDLLCNGLDNKTIAQQLGLALSTVKTHVQSLLAKTGARNRTDIVTTTLRRTAS
ncbi:response regulator transcription factor [Roseateles puraquae]|uniref:helix-turn-helix transcriptional regulator n=1 Tax=Roseateles puraquae TaxID=431059 RepID=UPI0031DEE5B3